MSPMQEHDALREFELLMTRRQLFGRASLGLGTATMASMLGPGLLAAGNRPNGLLGPRDEPHTSGLHHTPKAKRVIYLFMSGGPSHHDLASAHDDSTPSASRHSLRLLFERMSRTREFPSEIPSVSAISP